MIDWAARLYPRSWRDRYGDEFEALLEEIRPRWTDVLDILKGGISMRILRWNSLRIATLFALAGGFAAIVVSFAMPARLWRSGVTFVYQTPDTGHYADHTATFVRTALNKDYLERIIRTYNLYPEERQQASMAGAIKRAERATQAEILRTGEFRLSFAYPDAVIAQRVTNNMAMQFVEANFRNPELATGRARVAITQPAQPGVREKPNRRPFALTGAVCGIAIGVLAAWFRRRRHAASA